MPVAAYGEAGRVSGGGQPAEVLCSSDQTAAFKIHSRELTMTVRAIFGKESFWRKAGVHRKQSSELWPISESSEGSRLATDKERVETLSVVWLDVP
jgi:hypothetical protein